MQPRRYFIQLSSGRLWYQRGPAPHWTKTLDEATWFPTDAEARRTASMLLAQDYQADVVSEAQAFEEARWQAEQRAPF